MTYKTGVMYGLINTIPVAFLKHDLACDCTTGSSSEFDGTVLCQGQGILCGISRHGVFLMMCIFYLIASLNLALLMKLKNIYVTPNGELVMRYLPFIVPSICSIVSIALDIDPEVDYEKSFAPLITVRDAFSCSPRFPDFATEFVFKQLHFMLAALVVAIVIFMLVRHILGITSASSDLHRSMSSKGKRDLTSFSGHMTCWASAFTAVVESYKTIRKHLRSSKSERLVVLGIICVILFIVNLYITLSTLPLMQDFKDEAELQFDCKGSFKSQVSSCSLSLSVSLSSLALPNTQISPSLLTSSPKHVCAVLHSHLGAFMSWPLLSF
jgi:hypothetical protein